MSKYMSGVLFVTKEKSISSLFLKNLREIVTLEKETSGWICLPKTHSGSASALSKYSLWRRELDLSAG